MSTRIGVTACLANPSPSGFIRKGMDSLGDGFASNKHNSDHISRDSTGVAQGPPWVPLAERFSQSTGQNFGLLHQLTKCPCADGLGPIAKRLLGIRVDFQNQGVRPSGNGSHCH